MGDTTHISWCDATFNPWIGCTKVSDGCDNCYAEINRASKSQKVEWGKGKQRHLTSEANRRKPFVWERQAIKEGRRIKVFAASLSDVFDEEVPDEWRDDDLFGTIEQTPHLDWLVLTKRLAKMLRYVRDYGTANIPRNVWWGCSVENQAMADQRIPELLKLRPLVGDAPLWLSVEPLIGPVDLREWLPHEYTEPLPGGADCKTCGVFTNGLHHPHAVSGISWTIVGGESGPSARPMHPGWARSLRDQCVAAGVAFHFKQFGQWGEAGCCDDPCGNCVIALPDGSVTDIDWEAGAHLRGGIQLHRIGKKAAGRLLDGRTWDEFPVVAPKVNA